MSTQLHTNWVTIIGAPSSGKSSVIEELAARGYRVEREVARAYIEERMAHGASLEEVRGPAGVQHMQKQILARSISRDEQLDPDALIFFDRGLGDAIFYYTRAGLDPAPVWEVSRYYRYQAVFMLEHLPVTADDIRTEDDAAARQMQTAFHADYTTLGYDVIMVPVMSITERVDFILQHLRLPALSSTSAMA